MIIKGYKTLSGTLMSPLRIGNCAYIRHEAGYTRTSRVIAIKSVSREEILFETQNTNYRLVPEPVSEGAESHSIMSLAA